MLLLSMMANKKMLVMNKKFNILLLPATTKSFRFLDFFFHFHFHCIVKKTKFEIQTLPTNWGIQLLHFSVLLVSFDPNGMRTNTTKRKYFHKRMLQIKDDRIEFIETIVEHDLFCSAPENCLCKC